MMFAQQRNCLTMHFSERMPVAKQRMTVLQTVLGGDGRNRNCLVAAVATYFSKVHTQTVLQHLPGAKWDTF
jgi:hypothetical protein